MARGGKREGAGRPRGSRTNRPPLQLNGETVAPSPAPNPQTRMAALRWEVCRLVSDGMTVEEIASAIPGMSVERLERVFPKELANGRALYRREILRRLDEQSAAGNVTATRALESRIVADTASPEKRQPALGKKAAAAAAAAHAGHGTAWEDILQSGRADEKPH